MRVLRQHNADPRTLRRHPDNPRRGDTEAIKRSIRALGFFAPVVHLPDGTVLAGNHRLAAAIELGLESIPAIEVEVLDANEARRILLADNRTSDLATYDPQALNQALKALGDPGSLADIGFDRAFFRDLERRIERIAPAPKDPDAPPLVPVTPDSKPGGEYLLGPHVLRCGDSRDPKTLDGWSAVDAVITDPPYGVAYRGATKTRKAIANDELSIGELTAFLAAAFGAAIGISRPGAAWYVFAPAGVPSLAFHRTLVDLGVRRQGLVWDKGSPTLGHSDFPYAHEDIHYGWTPGAKHTLPMSEDGVQDRSVTSVWRFPKPSVSVEHPTMKPIALISHCLRMSTRRGDTVFDGFGGSGTTLLACAADGRVCRTVELDPGYCDVIRKRWTLWAVENQVEPGPGALAP